jgi:hypothetical protein
MSLNPWARRLAPLLCLALVAGPLPASASQTIRCESPDYQYRFCRANTDNRVQLVRQISNTDCREGRNWGYERGGVWVNRGCAAEFRVGSGGSNNAAAAAVAIVGLAAIAAAANNQNRHQQDDVASWAIGSFSGFDDYEGTDVQLRIVSGGSVTGRAGRHSFSGTLEGTRLQAGRHTFRISRSGNGFLAVDERDGNHRVTFQRTYETGGY